MKRFNPYKRYSCAWCYSSNTDIITDPKRDHSRESDFNFYIKISLYLINYDKNLSIYF